MVIKSAESSCERTSLEKENLMKKVLLVLITLITFVFLISLFSQEFTYVGANRCKVCHRAEKVGKQFIIWEESKHSKSFKILTSEKAQEVAKAEGMETKPTENPECLKCHSPLFKKTSNITKEGVTCEFCHGPGSSYKKLSIMENREEAAKNSLIIYDSSEATKKLCLTCHEDSQEKSFDFKASWEKIKHPVPGKK